MADTTSICAHSPIAAFQTAGMVVLHTLKPASLGCCCPDVQHVFI